MGINAHRTLSDGRTLSDVMEFDHVIMVNGDGTITDSLPNERAYWAPEVRWEGNGPAWDDPSWELMNGYSGQHGYAGPVMHSSEFIGGLMADDIMSTPGLYVAVVVEDLNGCSASHCSGGGRECNGGRAPAGWAVARKDIPHADYPHEPGRLYDCPACEAQCFCGANCPTCQRYGETETCRERHTECVYSGEHS